MPDELVAVWCPVEAVHIADDVYEIVEVNTDPEDSRWAFDTGARVRCRPTLTRDAKDTILVAIEQVDCPSLSRRRVSPKSRYPRSVLTAVKILIMLFRLVWLLALAIGIWIWTGHGYATLNLHIALGFCTVLLLAIIAVLGIVLRASLVHILLAGFWIILLPFLGFGQLRWMPGT